MVTTMFTIASVELSAVLHRPSVTTLVVTTLAALIGWAGYWFTEWSTRTDCADGPDQGRPAPVDDELEPPAVVAALTSQRGIPLSAVTATALDLASRGWIRLATANGELVVITRTPDLPTGALHPFEHQVLNHLISRSSNGMTTAGILAESHHRLNRRWLNRFRRSVYDTAQAMGLIKKRYSVIDLAPIGAVIMIGLLAAWFGAHRGTPTSLAESATPRVWWLVSVAALITLAVATLRRLSITKATPTQAGIARARQWMGFRRRLTERIPAQARVIASPTQQSWLAMAAVLGVNDQVLAQLPITPEDHRIVWSSAGESPRTVRTIYPAWLGYGRHPVWTAVIGAVVFFVARVVAIWLTRIGDGELFADLVDRLLGRSTMVGIVTDVVGIIVLIPLVVGLWTMVAGIIDSFVTLERTGTIVRSRRPREVLGRYRFSIVRPFARDDHFATYLAIDNGTQQRIIAVMAGEATTAPQGALVTVKVTPLLGYVRSTALVSIDDHLTD
ncbi:MAG: hypothetical protein CSA55_01635 [Ilumatobacter coccineus]|uniref:Predicted membrane protein YciQ-like C-terminal domain-containing protein n=1 Tax=Ilumatobacter coccineus TaxID=467094 RepID=A0A2G6KE83_9ACTN|nr:MAG: hypothetical protein CSA55_01635 [Ilumatobacter coccineus]